MSQGCGQLPGGSLAGGGDLGSPGQHGGQQEETALAFVAWLWKSRGYSHNGLLVTQISSPPCEATKTPGRRDSVDAAPAPPAAWPSEPVLPTAEAHEAQGSPEAAAGLSLLEVLAVSVVLEDASDQLSILGYIMPRPLEGRQSTALRNKSPDKPPVLLTGRKISAPLLLKGPASPEVRPGGQLAEELNKMHDLAFKTPAAQAIRTAEMLKKTQSDREEKGRKMIKSLQKQLINVKKERQAEVQSRNEYIAHLKDQLQEMKAKTNLENHYMKKNTELQIAQTQKKCNRTEEVLLEEIEKVRMKTEEENRIHMEIEMFLRKEQQRLEEQLEFWMEKFDKDTEMKQSELNALQAAKAGDLAHLQDLATTIREYEQVIIEDRIEKEKTRKKMEQDMLELKSAIKLQAWWRGTVIRKEIGGFKMPKKEKDDSKDSKGKEKDKRRGKK
ncbi:IQ domain-containing protein G [Fukomys damarensis]|uniref:Dynein regulatory complex protein 9 n=1 Tax=Fukomys damarensis TaxID=885580 RepID=A0A091DLT8_FUKDA|nr:IQ domain-containing protein G [Fukomys damarensis]